MRESADWCYVWIKPSTSSWNKTDCSNITSHETRKHTYFSLLKSYGMFPFDSGKHTPSFGMGKIAASKVYKAHTMEWTFDDLWYFCPKFKICRSVNSHWCTNILSFCAENCTLLLMTFTVFFSEAHIGLALHSLVTCFIYKESLWLPSQVPQKLKSVLQTITNRGSFPVALSLTFKNPLLVYANMQRHGRRPVWIGWYQEVSGT